MPRHPLYVPLLPAAVQAALGRVHPDTEAALALLRSEGFVSMGEIDIFDAGPLVQAEVGKLRSVQQTRETVVGEIVTGEAAEGPVFLLSNASLHFRACLGTPSELPDGTVGLAAPLAEVLQLRRGDRT